MRHARRYDTAASRWEGLGPYYAMFPTAFADGVVGRYTRPGEAVLDPFAGRGTAVFSAAKRGRVGLGVELNPVGWVYAKTKLAPAPLDAVLGRLEEVDEASPAYRAEADDLPVFFRKAFTWRVRSFLLAARERLDWRRRRIDRTAMAILLVYLHGKEGAALSNQMRQTKSLSPDYAVRWWAERGLKPPDLEPLEFLRPRLEWRYARGLPAATGSRAYLGDSVMRLPRLAHCAGDADPPRATLLFTSPPYFGVTNYHYDQWLRLWLLGGRPDALRAGGHYRDKFEHRAEYRRLLRLVFERAAPLLRPDATVYVRTDRREVTYKATLEVLAEVFPDKRLRGVVRPVTGETQTRLFGPSAPRVGEIDLILRPRSPSRSRVLACP
jgi:DNA methylase